MARYEGFAVFFEKKMGPASPAPNVDRNRPGPGGRSLEGPVWGPFEFVIDFWTFSTKK